MLKVDFINSFKEYTSNKEILIELNYLISNWYSFSNIEAPSNYIIDEGLDNLYIACLFWVNLREDELDGFRTKEHNKVFHSFLFNAIENSIPLNYLAILCPSYKKGKDVYGFKDWPGNTTYRAIANLNRICENSKKLNIPFSANVYFADISLERWNLVKEDISELIRLREIVKLDSIIANTYGFPYNKLSNIPFLKEEVGYEGKLIEKPQVSEKALERAKWKDRQFYKEQFGWTDEESDLRTQVHAHSYSIQSQELQKIYKQPVVLYSGYDYEKGALYNRKDTFTNIAIIYPKKSEKNEKQPTIKIWKN